MNNQWKYKTLLLQFKSAHSSALNYACYNVKQFSSTVVVYNRSVVKTHNRSRRGNERGLNWLSFRNINANTDENCV